VGRGRLFSALGELCWYLSGSNATEQIAYYVRKYRDFDEGGVIFGGYGPRLIAFDGRNQIQYVMERLRRSPSSRQAVIQLFDHDDVVKPHEDVPCTCTLQYLLRDGQLSAVTYMRSNDVHLGLPHDIFCFTMLQELIARSVDMDVGSYHHMVGSLHIYDDDRSKLQGFLGEGFQSTTLAMPAMPPGDPWPSVQHLLDVEQRLRAGVPPTEVEFAKEPYWADLERILAVFAVKAGPRETVEQLRSAMFSDYYANYVFDVLDALPTRRSL
jgi:thymidylate synthase